MKLRKFLCALILALFSLQTLGFTALADEGMWTFNNVPRAEIKKKYGFDVTDEWLKKVQLASVRFNNGGSGSFVSPNGLVLTNYHIVEDIVNEVSTPQKDLAKEGFDNVQTILGKPDNPLLPAGKINAVLILKTYHEVADPVPLLKHLRESLAPNARVGIIDRNRSAENHGVAEKIVIAEAQEAGYKLVNRYDFVKDGMDYFLVFETK